MKHLFIPYENRGGTLEDYKIEYRKEEHTDQIGPVENKWTAHVYEIQEKRNGKWLVVSSIDTSKVDFWGGALEGILQKIHEPLSDKSDYKWAGVKQPIVDFWHKKQEADKQRDIAAGGKGQWTSMGDGTLWILMHFVATAYGIKWELLYQIPNDEEQGINSADAFEKEMPVMAFDEVIARNKLKQISEDPNLSEIEKAEAAILFILEHSRKLPYSSRNYLLDPQYDDETPLLSPNESRELFALFKIYDEVEKDIDSKIDISKEEKNLQKYDFWETQTGKRLNYLNNRRVHGATLSFAKQEEKKMQIANKISDLLLFLLGSWGLSAKEAQRKFMELYVKERWQREQRKNQFKDLISRGRQRDQILRNILAGRWDSDSLSFFGIVVGIFLGIFLGIYSLLNPNINFWTRVIISLVASLLSIKLISILMEVYRKEILMWTQKILNPPDKPKKG